MAALGGYLASATFNDYQSVFVGLELCWASVSVASPLTDGSLCVCSAI
jgi:hypothetical protein